VLDDVPVHVVVQLVLRPPDPDPDRASSCHAQVDSFT
jgi:hypothetical protein